MKPKTMKFMYYTLHVLCGVMILTVILATILGEGEILMWSCTALMVSNIVAIRTIKRKDELLATCKKLLNELEDYFLAEAEQEVDHEQ